MTNREKYVNQATDEEIVDLLRDVCTQTTCPYNGGACSTAFCADRLKDWLKQEAPHEKTYAEDFFEKFPNAHYKYDYNNIKFPDVCIDSIYGDTCSHNECHYTNCSECWLQPMKKGGK